MYFKEIEIDKIKNNIELEQLIKRIAESSLIKQIQETNLDDRYEGIDSLGSPFTLKYSDSLVYLNIEIRANNYLILEKMTEFLANEKISIKETNIIDQFEILRTIKGDVRFIKNTIIVFLTLTILNIIISLLH